MICYASYIFNDVWNEYSDAFGILDVFWYGTMDHSILDHG